MGNVIDTVSLDGFEQNLVRHINAIPNAPAYLKKAIALLIQGHVNGLRADLDIVPESEV